jgi:hypothetical protein
MISYTKTDEEWGQVIGSTRFETKQARTSEDEEGPAEFQTHFRNRLAFPRSDQQVRRATAMGKRNRMQALPIK